MRRLCVMAAVLLMAVGGVSPAASASSRSATACDITWGSLPKSASGQSPREITNVRAGQDPCFDRMVIDLGPATSGRIGFEVHYGPVSTQGEGAPIPLAGAADLDITVFAPAYDVDTGQPTYNPADDMHLVNVNGYTTFRQIAFGGSFEATTTFGLGVRAHLPFRAFVLAGPGSSARLVIDVAHQW
jgi:hypothetical protein